MRTHVVLPEALVAEVDKLAGKRKRSSFIEEAVRLQLKRERQRQALKRLAGALDPADYPHWSTPEKVSEWIRASRREGTRIEDE